MGTRSTVAMLYKDGTIRSVYSHWDGYISHNGVLLYSYYQDANKVKELINLGSISGLRENVHPPIGKEHNYNKADETTTIFHGRDRGDEDTNAESFLSLEEYIKNGNFQEYDYLFDEKKNKWFLLDSANGKLKVLETVIKNDENVKEDIKQMINAKKQAKKLERDLKKKEKSTQNKMKI